MQSQFHIHPCSFLSLTLPLLLFNRCERPPIKPKQTADPAMSSPENIPVHTWLDSIKMSRYTDNFVKAGYKTMADCTNLTKEQLQKMGITARGHLHKITSNIPSTSSAS